MLDYTGFKDKKGIPICVGDLIKINHFTDRKKKRHYMYRQVRKIGDKYICFDIIEPSYKHPLNVVDFDDVEVLDGVEFNFNDVTYFWCDRKRKAVSDLFPDQTS